MKYKVYRKDLEIWKKAIYLLPTIRLRLDDLCYPGKNISIEFHFLTVHARLLFLERRFVNG